MGKIIAACLTMLALLAVCYYLRFYPPTIYKNNTQHALDEVTAAVVSKDRAKITATLTELLAEDAHIALDVRYVTLMQQTAPVLQEFDAGQFARFIDNTLYSLNDYDFHASMDSIALSPDHKTATFQFTANAWGDSLSQYSGADVAMRTSAEMHCEGTVTFMVKKATFNTARCAVQLVTLPKAGEEDKLRGNPEALQKLLR